jgi:hypothetical protein
MPKDLKANYEQFARTVTTHLLDASYINYKANTIALLSGELNKNVIDWMRRPENGYIARNSGEMEQETKDLYEQRQVCSVRIDQVNIDVPGKNKPVSAEVSGVVALHSTKEDATNPVPFHFVYLMDLRTNPDGTLQSGDDNRPLPRVVGFREIKQGQ